MRLARARGAGQQHGRLRAHGHALDLLDQRIEALVARRNAALQEVQRLRLRLAEALGQDVVAGEVQVCLLYTSRCV